MLDWETIKNAWPFAAIVGTHVVRTEVSRAVTKNKLNAGEKNFERIEKQLETISADIKHLLERRS